MSGFPCPKCRSEDTVREEVDVGVGTIYGPWHCNFCGYDEKADMAGLLPDFEDDDFASNVSDGARAAKGE